MDASTEEEIVLQIAGDPDDPAHDPTYPDDAAKYPIVYPPADERKTIRLDADILAWLEGQGLGYQTRVNAILKGYMQDAERYRKDASTRQ